MRLHAGVAGRQEVAEGGRLAGGAGVGWVAGDQREEEERGRAGGSGRGRGGGRAVLGGVEIRSPVLFENWTS